MHDNLIKILDCMSGLSNYKKLERKTNMALLTKEQIKKKQTKTVTGYFVTIHEEKYTSGELDRVTSSYHVNGDILNVLYPKEMIAELKKSDRCGLLAVQVTIYKQEDWMIIETADSIERGVPLSIFKPSGTKPNLLYPDFSMLSITDYGNTIKLGSYEAAVDAVIEEGRIEWNKTHMEQSKEVKEGNEIK